MNRFDELLKLDDVARIFQVSKGTIRAWTNSGKLACVRTPGGQRRFRQDDVQRILDGGEDDGRKTVER